MLRQRGRDLVAGNVTGYLGPLAPEVRTIEEPIARGARLVPLSDITFVFNPEPGVSLNAASFLSVSTQILYRYKSLPQDNVFEFQMIYDVQKVDGRWRITRAAVDPKVPLPEWARGPIEINRSAHFLVLYRPGLTRVAEAVSMAEQARTNLIGKLSLVPDGRHLMLLAKDKEEFDELTGTPGEDGVLALAGFVFHGEGVPTSRHLVVNMEASFAGSSNDVKIHGGETAVPLQVFQHELGHLALSRYTTPITPAWVVEGAAMYLSGERRTDGWRRLVEEDLLNEISVEAISGNKALPGVAYPYANATVLYLAGAFGPRKFWDLYGSFRRFGSDAVGPEQAAAVSHVLLGKVYRMDEKKLDDATRGFIRSQLQAH